MNNFYLYKLSSSNWIRAQMSVEYDVVVVGGGPAGLSAARRASSGGADVLLLELQAQIGGQTKTSAWVPPGLLEEKFNRAITGSVEKIRLHSVHRKLEIEGNFGKIVDRKILDKLLASEAVKSGVDIWVGSPVTDLLEENQKIRGVRSEAGDWSEEIESKIVIDASGAKAEWSSLFLRKILNSNWDREETTYTNEYLMTEVPEEGKVDIYYNSVLAPSGYAWIYPAERKLAIAGVRGVRIHPDSALDEFIGQEEPSRLQGSVPIGAYRGQLPLEGPPESTTANGIIAVGSSAGQIYPVSGHGMKYALEAGEIAGRITSEAIQEDRTENKKLQEYDHFWRNKFEEEIRVGSILRRALEISPNQKMDALLDVLEENPELQEKFVNIFLGENLEDSVKDFLDIKECRKIFGENTVNKLRSIYS
ncbi:hypothetical protein AKJ65_03930 [candidate division MSBL1 archaeon SCGC-AAA259E19]|uniref:FAD/NAD(P)-binding domain-containing protein n=1 Tax=candidate division MSBL1 archaeon SCGC-AAA259E19 TaxID=1698264 RepID=A0A133UKG8_9EURY|nr:hypothetical protein AKJ65_03930 [candidate division MSBL1 archaeon SCGC-AAA259E19]